MALSRPPCHLPFLVWLDARDWPGERTRSRLSARSRPAVRLRWEIQSFYERTHCIPPCPVFFSTKHLTPYSIRNVDHSFPFFRKPRVAVPQAARFTGSFVSAALHSTLQVTSIADLEYPFFLHPALPYPSPYDPQLTEKINSLENRAEKSLNESVVQPAKDLLSSAKAAVGGNAPAVEGKRLILIGTFIGFLPLLVVPPDDLVAGGWCART